MKKTFPMLRSVLVSEYFCLKKNDLGTALFYATGCDGINDLAGTHPTSGNGAVAFARQIGFKNIVLFGLDLGMRSAEQHHSENSLYFGDDKRYAIPKIRLDLEIEGNFGGKVYSTFPMESARFVLGNVLTLNPDMTCYNTSDGAKIPKTIPLPLDELESTLRLTPIDKQQEVNLAIARCLIPLPGDVLAEALADYWKKLYLNVEYCIATFLQFFDEPIYSKRELIDRFEQQHEAITKLYATNKGLSVLVGGTMKQLQSVIAAIMLRIQDGERFHELLKPMLQVCREHLNDGQELYRTCLDKTIEEYPFEEFKQRYPGA